MKKMLIILSAVLLIGAMVVSCDMPVAGGGGGGGGGGTALTVIPDVPPFDGLFVGDVEFTIADGFKVVKEENKVVVTLVLGSGVQATPTILGQAFHDYTNVDEGDVDFTARPAAVGGTPDEEDIEYYPEFVYPIPITTAGGLRGVKVAANGPWTLVSITIE